MSILIILIHNSTSLTIFLLFCSHSCRHVNFHTFHEEIWNPKMSSPSGCLQRSKMSKIANWWNSSPIFSNLPNVSVWCKWKIGIIVMEMQSKCWWSARCLIEQISQKEKPNDSLNEMNCSAVAGTEVANDSNICYLVDFTSILYWYRNACTWNRP